MKKLALAALAAASLLAAVDTASAQLVRPQWNRAGSAVCPEYYDYYQGWCRPRGGRHRGGGYGGGYYGGGYGGYRGEGIPPQWNRRGSAVCPQGYDYHARVGLCLPQR